VSLGDRLRWLLVSSGGLGCSPFAPGTVGTLGGVALAVGLQAASPTLAAALWSWGVAAAVLWLWGSLQSRFVARVISTFSRRSPPSAESGPKRMASLPSAPRP
jgi:hypothetical protein